MAVKKSGSAISLPPKPAKSATVKQIDANTRAVRKAIQKKSKAAVEKERVKAALKRNAEARRDFARSKKKSKSRRG